MILNDNICTEIGDVIFMQSVIMLGITQVNSIADSTTGESGIRTFDRKFAYSLDMGVTFSDVYATNNATAIQKLNNLLTTNHHELVFNFIYRRIGTDTTGQLQLNNITVNGAYVERQTNFVISKKTMFADLVYNNIDVMNLVANLSQKMYEYGIVPSYIERKELDVDPLNDQDYIDFWQVVSTFYAIFFIDSLKFENIYWEKNLLCEYLRQRGLYFCNCNNIIELQLIAQNFYAEIRARGTQDIFNKQGYEYQIGNRYSYVIGNYAIAPATPIKIDGVIYKEAYTMPFGWIVQNTLLVSPDMNYHQIVLFNTDTNQFDIFVTARVVQLSTNQSGIKKQYNGEYLRLICFQINCDEFIYNNVPKKYLGWCVGNSSPLYRGMRPQRGNGLIKAYETDYAVIDLNKYPVTDPVNVFVGITLNPYGVRDTVIYMTNDGTKCFLDTIPKVYNLINKLKFDASYSAANNVEGLITLTNTSTGDTQQIPFTLTGNQAGIQTFEISSDLVAGQYDVNISGTFISKVSGYCRVGVISNTILSTTGNYNQTFHFAEVQIQLLEISLNFSV